MIEITRDTPVPSVDTCISILESYNQLMPIYIDFDKLCQYISWYQLEIQKIEGPLFNLLQYVPNRNKLDVCFIEWLRRHGEDTSLFNVTKGGKISLDAKSFEKVRQSGRFSEDALGVMKTYQLLMNYYKTSQTLLSLLQFPVCDYYSYENHRMIAITPKWSRQNTGRLGMYDPAIQNFPKGIQDLFTVPKGWIYVHTDSGQVEPRITYSAFVPDPQIKSLMVAYNDAYYALVHYCTMDKELIKQGGTSFALNEITDEMTASRQAIKRYGNSVMYGSTSNVENDPIKTAMIDRIGNHPMRLDLINRIKRQLSQGNYIFKTYFGTEINIMNSPKLATIEYGTEYYESELIKLAINNPIQGTAADLMRISIGRAYTLLSKKAPDSVILDYVHDAGCFAICEDDWDAVGDEIKDIVAYNVQGWVPIYADAEIGREKGKNGIFPDLY